MTLPELLAYFAVLHKTLLGVNAVASALMASVLLGLYFRAVREQRWLFYFGMAYSVFFLQYLSYWLVKWLGGGFAHLAWLSPLGELILNLGSVVNNILFFAAAVALLGFRRTWNVSFSTISILGLLVTLTLPDSWSRIPAAVLSFSCFVLLGWALYVNLRDMGERLLAYFFLGCVWLYAVANLADAALPWLAQRHSTLHDQIVSIFQTIPPGLKENLGGLTVLDAYDAPLFALVLALKIVLFGAALLVVIQSLVWIKPRPYRDLLTSVTYGVQQFLSSEGIVRTIAENFNADLVQVCLRVPGREMNRVIWHRWRKSASVQDNVDLDTNFKTFELATMPTPAETMEGRVLVSGYRRGAPMELPSMKARGWQLTSTNSSHSVVIPILYHRSTIGTLTIQRNGQLPFNKTSLRNAIQLADFVAPLIQAQRHLTAIDVFATQLPSLGSKGVDALDPISLRVDVVHNTLAPLVTGVALNIGFQPFWAARTDDWRSGDQTLRSTTKDCSIVLDEEIGRLSRALASDRALEVKSHDLSLGELRIGDLRLVYFKVDEAGFDHSRASLGQSDVHRRATAALLTSAILDLVRTKLGAVINDLLLKLREDSADSLQQWIAELNRAAQAAGILWVTARVGTNERVWGDPGAVAELERSHRMERDVKFGEQQIEALAVEALAERGANCIVTLPLRHAILWLGVTRKGFGPELAEHTPWRAFLVRFAEAADASLLPILAGQEMKRMAEDQMRLQGLRTAMVTMGTMTHQLSNFLRGFSASVSSLEEAVLLGRVQVDADARETIEHMHHATRELDDLLEPMKTLTIVQSKNPCDLWEVIERAHALFRIDLEQRKTTFEVLQRQPNAVLMIGVPADVAILAISNLISNSLDALGEGGRITLEVEERAHEVLCHVVDNGPGLPASTRGNPFGLGVTTKATSGGWGLYLTRRSLIENQAKIELVKPGPGGTQFTIYFPKAKASESEINYQSHSQGAQ